MTDFANLYPAAPSGVPANLAKPGLRYRLQIVLVLLAFIPFLLLWFALLAGAFGLMVWAVWPVGVRAASVDDAWWMHLVFAALRISVLVLGGLLFAFLFKGFFKRGGGETSPFLKVTEREQPELFQFIRSLSKEIGSSMPERVYLSHDVNAAVLFPTSILNLVVPPQKDLLIGLGLVNGLNLVEFKALLAHEFGHFSQRTLRLDGYVSVAYQVIDNMVNVRDRWDKWVIRGFDLPWVSIIAVPLYGLVELARWLLKAAFRVLHSARMSLLRQMELNADLVAVGAAGSDAPVHLLFKGDFEQACLQQSVQDLALAAEHGFFSRDLFYHQERSGDRLRVTSKNPDLGRLPDLPSDPSGSATVFQPGDSSTLAMWADHPSHYDRERNAKHTYLRSPQDDRSARLLFHDGEALREQVTRQFYRTCLGLEPDESLADPEIVQAFIDEEHADPVFNPRYLGIYDNRWLELSDFDRLICDFTTEAQPQPEQLLSSPRELYSTELQSWVTKHRHRWDEVNSLSEICSGRSAIQGPEFEFRGRCFPIEDADRLRTEVQDELEVDRRYLADFDRSVFALHSQLAQQSGKQEEFGQRYLFHLNVQQLLRFAWDQRNEVDGILRSVQGARKFDWGQVGWLEGAVGQVHERITEAYRHAGRLVVPPLKYLKAGQSLASHLPPEPSLPDVKSAESYAALDFGPLAAFHNQLSMLVDRLSRIQAKSFAGILKLQEELASQWRQHAEAASPLVMQPAEEVAQMSDGSE